MDLAQSEALCPLFFTMSRLVVIGFFPSNREKCCFHFCIRSLSSFALILDLFVVFLPVMLLTIFHTIADFLLSAAVLISSICFCKYLVCSFIYVSYMLSFI